MTKIDLITGILGSGKTTFLLKYARNCIDRGENIAILENDFGAVNIDMMILQELKCDSCRLEMISGGCDQDCHKRRFKTQLIALGMQHFDRVIVEPSGIFDMDEFFDILHDTPLDRWFEIGSILTVVDAEMEEELSEQMEYLLGSQAACCGKLILSKLGSIQNETAEQTVHRVLSHVGSALEDIRCDRRLTSRDIIAKDWESFDEGDFELFRSAGYRGSDYVKRFSPDDIQSSVHYFMHIKLPSGEIAPLIDRIMRDEGCGRIFRIKGALPLENGGWLKINAARERIETSPMAEGQPVLIVIGDHISRKRIDQHLRPLNTDPEYVSV